jgi:hypothetical protein
VFPHAPPSVFLEAESSGRIWAPQDMLRLRAAFDALLEAQHEARRRNVLFLVPPNNKCSEPLYEMVFMLDTWLRRHGARDGVDIAWTTYESGYIQAFGPRLNDVVTREFAARGIAGHKEYAVDRVERAS